jgi:hypothetical protein
MLAVKRDKIVVPKCAEGAEKKTGNMTKREDRKTEGGTELTTTRKRNYHQSGGGDRKKTKVGMEEKAKKLAKSGWKGLRKWI